MPSMWSNTCLNAQGSQPSMAKLIVQGDATVIKKDREGIPG